MLLLLEFQINMTCKRCEGKMFVDRIHSNIDHLETYCVKCGSRKFYHPPSESAEGKWLLQKEKFRAKHIIANL
jgi:predicted  nucleic acid-binding Zn-ribbon protein